MKMNYDVIVVGGGFAGFGAACAAARGGAKTLLVERNGFLSGAASDALVIPFMRYYTRGNNERVNAGLFEELQNRLQPAFNKNYYREEDLKQTMETICTEYGVELLYHTQIIDAVVEDGAVAAVKAHSVGKTFELRAKLFIDCTGDANLAAMAGCGYDLGENGTCQPMTLCFRLCNVDMDGFLAIRDQLNERYKEDQQKGLIKNPRENVLWFKTCLDGVLHFNTTRIINVDPTDPAELTRAEIEGRRQVLEMIAFFKRHFECFKDAELVMSAPRTGVRESRLIHGEYTLNENDILEGKKFESSIACGAYEVDIHNPNGTGTVIKKLADGVYYTIPYEACIAKDVKNLLVAGRCISSTHSAQSAYRIMPICCCIGEGVGVAAAEAIKNGISDPRMVDIKSVQAELTRHNARYK